MLDEMVFAMVERNASSYGAALLVWETRRQRQVALGLLTEMAFSKDDVDAFVWSLLTVRFVPAKFEVATGPVHELPSSKVDGVWTALRHNPHCPVLADSCQAR